MILFKSKLPWNFTILIFLIIIINFFRYDGSNEQHNSENRLRTNSRSLSEENIVIDVSKEALSVQGIQDKIQSTFSSIKNAITGAKLEAGETSEASSDKLKRNYAFTEKRDGFHDLPTAPEDDFIFTVPRNYLMSPYMAPNEILCQFPKTNILSTIVDPCIDDCVEFGKKLRSLGVDTHLDVLGALNHGFLNFAQVNLFAIFVPCQIFQLFFSQQISSDCHDGSKLCMKRLAHLLELDVEIN